jgi:O-antigen ligase
VTDVEGGRDRTVRLIGWPLTIVGFTYLVLIGGGFPGVFAPAFRMADVVIAAIALVLWLVASFYHPRWRPNTVLWPAFGTMLIAFAVTTVTSVLPRLSLEYVAYAVVLIGLYLLLVRLQAHPFIGRRIGSIAVILVVAIGVYYLYVSVTLWQAWWAIVGRLTIPPLRPGFESLAFGNPSSLGATCVLLFVAGAAHLGLVGWGRRIVVVVLGALVLVVCLVTGARSVWLGVAVTVAIVALLWFASPARRDALAASLRTGRGRAVLAAVVVIGGVGAVVAGPGILVRMGFGDPYRPGYWLASIRMFRDAPLFGQGPGTWAAERAPFTTPGDLDFYIPHGHNVYLQTIGELGLAGVIAGIVVIFVVGRLIGRSLAGTAEQRRYAWATIAAIAYLGGHQLVDVVTNLPVVLFALALPISRLDALALAARDVPEESAGRPRAPLIWLRRLAVVPLIVVAGLAVAWLAWTTRVAVKHQDAVDAANDGRWAPALSIALDVVAADPDIPAYRVTLGLARARTENLSAAVAELRTAAEIDEFPQSWLDIAALEVLAGRPDEAHDALDHALRLGFQQPSISLAATGLYARLGDIDAARESLADAFEEAPSIAGDPWWNTQPGAEDVYQPVIRQLLDAGDATAFRIALETGRLDAAQKALSSLGGDTTVPELVLAAWSGDADARRQLEERAAARPLAVEAVAWSAIVADHLGDLAARNRYVAWAETINGGAGVESIGYRIVDLLPSGRGPVGTFGQSYGQYLYLRPVPRDELVPGLPQLVYR